MEMNGGYIAVNETLQTSCSNIYAIGDVKGGLQLAHAASAEARNAIRIISGKTPEEKAAALGCKDRRAGTRHSPKPCYIHASATHRRATARPCAG